jgi:hypothetical protein
LDRLERVEQTQMVLPVETHGSTAQVLLHHLLVQKVGPEEPNQQQQALRQHLAVLHRLVLERQNMTAVIAAAAQMQTALQAAVVQQGHMALGRTEQMLQPISELLAEQAMRATAALVALVEHKSTEHPDRQEQNLVLLVLVAAAEDLEDRTADELRDLVGHMVQAAVARQTQIPARQ